MAIVSIKPHLADVVRTGAGGRPSDVLDAMTEMARAIGRQESGGGQEATPPASQSSAKSFRLFWPASSLAAVVVAGLVLGQVMKDAKYSETAVAIAGLSVFAGIYAAAQGLERFLEPISHWFLSTQNGEKSYGDAVVEADKAITAWRANPTDETRATAETKMKSMADAKAKIDERRDDRSAAYWAIASIAGMLVSGFFHLYLLKLIGVTTTLGWDVAATGVIVGSGTKPVHDLITKASSSSSAASGTGGSWTDTT